MKIITVPDHVSREELLEEVQSELNALDSCGKAIVLVDDKKIRYHKDVDMGMHHIRYMPLKQTMGQRQHLGLNPECDEFTILDEV